LPPRQHEGAAKDAGPTIGTVSEEPHSPLVGHAAPSRIVTATLRPQRGIAGN